jgi:hypothetical protein
MKNSNLPQIKITNEQMGALTWMTEDLNDLCVLDNGATIKVVYKADIDCNFMDAVLECSKDDFSACILNVTSKLN